MSPRITAKIGAHVSVAGGIDKAPARAAAEGCEVFQCFTRPPQGGAAPPLTDTLVANFKMEMARSGQADFYIHTPYYLNFASLTPTIRGASVRVCREELERGSVLGARYVMTHLGSHSGQMLEEGLEKVTAAVQKILDGYHGTTELLLEISAGSGSVIGDTFEEIGQIIRGLARLNFAKQKFGGVCFDTCHAFASGYDFRTPEQAEALLQKFDAAVGLDWLKLCHVSDSKFDLGARRDRHHHLGQGFIGEAGLRALLTTAPFSRIDWLLETENVGREKDITVLKRTRI